MISVGGLEPSLDFWDFRDGDPRSCPFSNLDQCGSNWTQTGTVAMQDFVAPAVDVLSTFYVGAEWNPGLGCVDNPVPGNPDLYPGFGLCTGTSMAAPHGTGLGGLLRSINPLLNKEEIRDVITGHADRAGAWDPQFGYGVPDAAASAEAILGLAGGTVVDNRLTPLFQLFSDIAGDYAYTTVPQYASALTWADEEYLSVHDSAPRTGGYGPFFPGGQTFQIGPCDYDPRADVYIFTTDRSPNGHLLVPLYRLSFNEAYGGNPDDRDHNYTTEAAGIEAFRGVGYRLDGVEGYIYERCEPEPSCIPSGAVRLYRLYNATIDDWAIFPESKLAAFQAAGYTSQTCCNDWIGYVYENVDGDLDNLIDGFESLIGTDPTNLDSDCDGVADGIELPLASLPVSDPLNGPCGPGNLHIADTFSSGGGPLHGRLTEIGEATWVARSGARVSSGKVIDSAAIGGVPFNPRTLPGNPIVEMSADVNPTNTGWNAVGFSSSDTRPFWAAGQLWVNLRPQGSYFVHGDGQVLAQGTIPGSPTGGYHQIDIRFDTGSRLATVQLNGTQVLSQILALMPNIQFAGFHMHQSAEFGGQVDNFQVADVTSQENILISDSFAGDGSLNGRLTEVGSQSWVATAGAYTQFGRIFDSAAIGGVRVDLGTVGDDTVTVEADVSPQGTGWIGVGFARQADQPYWSDGELWALIYPSGYYVVYVGGIQQAVGTVSGSLSFHLEVSYNPATRQAAVHIGSTEVFAQVLATVSDIQHAGFHIFAGQGNVDNFQVIAASP